MINKNWPSLFFINSIPMLFVIIWSAGAIFIKTALSFTDPFTLLLLRLIIASIVLVFLAIVTSSPWPTQWKLLRRIIGTGLVLQFCYQATFSYAIYCDVSPAILTIILGLQPLLTAMISSFILKNYLSLQQWIGLTLGLVGVIFVVVSDFSVGGMTLAGFIFSVLCLFSITVGSLLQKNLTEMNLLTGSAIQLSVGIIPTTLLTFFFGHFSLPTHPAYWISVGWISLVVSVGGTFIYYTLLKKKQIISTTSLFYLVPPLTALLCYFVFNEPIYKSTIIGIFLVSIAIVFGNNKPKFLLEKVES